MPLQRRHKPLPFKRSRTTVAIEHVDESWALELINEAEREEIIRVEGQQMEVVEVAKLRLEDTNPTSPVEAEAEIHVEEDTGLTAIDIQKMYWTTRTEQPAGSHHARSDKSMFKYLLKRWMQA